MSRTDEALPETAGERDVIVERHRQRDKLWGDAHDDEHDDRSLVAAAICYAGTEAKVFGYPRGWPVSWGPEHWKPKGERADLVRAAALLIAEIDRLDRYDASGKTPLRTDV